MATEYEGTGKEKPGVDSDIVFRPLVDSVTTAEKPRVIAEPANDGVREIPFVSAWPRR